MSIELEDIKERLRRMIVTYCTTTLTGQAYKKIEEDMDELDVALNLLDPDYDRFKLVDDVFKKYKFGQYSTSI